MSDDTMCYQNIIIVTTDLVDDDNGVSGCISRLVISGTPVNLGADILDSKAFSDCPVCTSRTCMHGGSCQAAATINGFRCLCTRNYSGDTCELVGDKCTPSKSLS